MNSKTSPHIVCRIQGQSKLAARPAGLVLATTSRWLAAFTLAMSVAACGGGGTSAPSTAGADPAPQPAPAAPKTSTFVVALGGADQNPGTQAAPLATLQRAVDLAQPGDTIQLRAGVHTLAKAVRVVGKLATGDMPLTIEGESGAVLRSAGEGVPGVWRGMVEIENSTHVTVKNIAVENSSFFGFRVLDSEDIRVLDSRSTVSLGSGIYAKNAKRLSVEGNDVSRFCDRNATGAGEGVLCQEGISIVNVDGFSVQNNLVHDAPQSADVGPGGGEGIDIKAGSKNGVVAFNKVWNLVQLGIYVDGWSQGVSNVSVHGNRVWNTYMGIVVSSEMGGTVADVSIFNNIVNDVGVDGIHVGTFKSGDAGDGLRTRLSIYNNTIVNAGIKEAKPPFYSRWSPAPFPDGGTGIKVTTINVSDLQIFDNIVSGSKTAAIQIKPQIRGTSRVETNLAWPGPTPYADDAFDGIRPILAPPGFVASSTTPWHLGAGSPAVAAGSGGVPLPADAEKVTRPLGVIDLGALTYRNR
jgi:hypothetical protein